MTVRFGGMTLATKGSGEIQKGALLAAGVQGTYKEVKSKKVVAWT
jgi:hypothetical protein